MTVSAKSLINEIEQYWTRRADSYSEIVKYEMTHENEVNWMKVIVENLSEGKGLSVLDIGTGPGFFAIGLAKRGYDITAVDYTQAMLDQAICNAGEYAGKIKFYRMDANHLNFADDSFDAIVTRNLTWNLEQPQNAYAEWHRVLKKGGVLLNFDAGWYSYLYDEEKKAQFDRDKETVVQLGIKDYNDYSESDIMEEIARNLILSRCQRPEADLRMLYDAGFAKVTVEREIGQRVWNEEEKINYVSTPMFLLRAVK